MKKEFFLQLSTLPRSTWTIMTKTTTTTADSGFSSSSSSSTCLSSGAIVVVCDEIFDENSYQPSHKGKLTYFMSHFFIIRIFRHFRVRVENRNFSRSRTESSLSRSRRTRPEIAPRMETMVNDFIFYFSHSRISP